uniref:Calpain catalytic domain-containing protein n=1 Tax=Panagrellus redivivus TaxID=6233 RepID=A0A7E4V1L1_PANRE
MFVISFSLLGPAIIFTMLVYAQVAAFCMNSTHVLVYNAVPVCFFIFCCFCMDSSVQLFFAKVASIVYAFLMLAVMIATAQQIVLETIFSLMSIFVLMLIVIFMFAALVHPKEFKNILFGAIYFLIIPSAYVFLSLYSLVNLNVINRGTREAVVKATGDKTNSDKLGEKWVKRLGLDNEKSVAFKLMPWLTPKVPEDNESLGALERKVERPEALQKSMDIGQNGYSAQPQDAFSRLHIISHEQRQKGLANKYEATPARTLENVHAPHVAFRVRWIIFIVIMCITFDNASATPLEATKEKTPKSLADLTALAIGTVVTYFGLSESLWNWWPVTDCIIFTMSLVVAAVRMMENAYSASEGFECIVLWHSLACGCWCMIEFLNSQRTRQIDVNMNPARASPSMMYRNSVSFVPSMVFFFCEVYDNGISLRLLAILVPLMVLLTVVLGFSFFTCQEPARNAAAQDAMPPPPVAIPPLFSSLSTHRFGDSNDFRSFDQALPSPQNSHHVSMVYQVESRFEQCACIEEVYVIPQSLVRFEQLCLIVVPKKTWILKHHPGMPNNTLFRAVIFDEICRFAARNLLPMPKHAIIIKDSGFQTLRTVNSMWPNMKSISCLEGFFSPEWPRVIDSKLELIAFPDGYIEPEGLERIYADSELVSQCFIHFQRSILLAIVVPDEQALFVKNKQMYRLSGNFWRLCRHHQIKQLILNAMRSTAIKNNLVNFEIVQDIYISPDRFSVHNNLLTFAQKKNRPNLKARFQSHIDKMIVKIVSNQ